jgi:hypothetical protein
MTMNSTMARVPIAILLVLLAPVPKGARAEGTDRQSAFVQALVKAVNSRDMEQQKALIHPGSLACGNAEGISIFNESFFPRIRGPVPANYRWRITQIPPGQPPMFADKFDYPVRPTHLLQIDYDPGPNRSKTLVVQIVYDEGRWSVVSACPTPETAAAAEKAKRVRAESATRARILADGISPRLKETVVRLLKEGRRVDAIRQYSEATGEDITTAKEVVELLSPRDW